MLGELEELQYVRATVKVSSYWLPKIYCDNVYFWGERKQNVLDICKSEQMYTGLGVLTNISEVLTKSMRKFVSVLVGFFPHCQGQFDWTKFGEEFLIPF